MTNVRVAALHVYPVKGCRGLTPLRAKVAVTGLASEGVLDREWMVIDPQGKFITQREVPQLALIDVAVANGSLCLSAPGFAALCVPLAATESSPRPVTVWHSHVEGLDAGDFAAAWLESLLGVPARLVRFHRELARACNPDFVGDSGANTLFSDSYPYLVTGTESLVDLNARLARRGAPALPMNRFRPNIVLDGLPAGDEDHLDTITIGEAVLKFVKPCVRCQVTTTDQATAEVGVEPLRTLGEYRMDERFGGVTFGMNAIVIRGADTTIAVDATADVQYRF